MSQFILHPSGPIRVFTNGISLPERMIAKPLRLPILSTRLVNRLANEHDSFRLRNVRLRKK